MEKLGVVKEDLVNELQEKYKHLREQEAKLVKTGSPVTPKAKEELEAVKEKIDELKKG